MTKNDLLYLSSAKNSLAQNINNSIGLIRSFMNLLDDPELDQSYSDLVNAGDRFATQLKKSFNLKTAEVPYL
jgi:hypothetical protein